LHFYLFREYLIQRVDCEGLFDAHPECKNFIIEALKFHLAGAAAFHGVPSSLGEASLSKLSASFFTSERTKPRQPIGLPKVMLAIGKKAQLQMASG
jgi:kelch-like protein 2/3